jgi:UDP-N-acetylmuramoylalanine-D-glutamate ligase
MSKRKETPWVFVTGTGIKTTTKNNYKYELEKQS